MSPDELEEIIKSGDLEALKKETGWFEALKKRAHEIENHEDREALNGYELPYQACNYAAAYNQLAILKWLHANGLGWDWQVCSGAAQEGHLDLLKWAHANGAPFGQFTFAFAVSKGANNRAVWEWLIKKGCSWGGFTVQWGIDSGSVEVVKWLRAHSHILDDIWDANWIRKTAWGLSDELAEWLRGQENTATIDIDLRGESVDSAKYRDALKSKLGDRIKVSDSIGFIGEFGLKNNDIRTEVLLDTIDDSVAQIKAVLISMKSPPGYLSSWSFDDCIDIYDKKLPSD